MNNSRKAIIRTWDKTLLAVCHEIEALTFESQLPEDQRRRLRGIVNELLTYYRGADIFPKRKTIALLAREYAASERAITYWKKEGCPFDSGQRKVLDWLATRRLLPKRTKLKFERQINIRRKRATHRELQQTVRIARFLSRGL